MADDFRLVLTRTKTDVRDAAARRIREFFSAVRTKALWYFNQPPDFDAIIAREVSHHCAGIDRTSFQ